ncbi:efflux RND transporter periplasmic adaptor subunit [Paenibacillus sp. FSL M8-0334]|uniref:Efflux RND transporter periplasmic adaptor subunit n=1 Tax=Paenibacillus campinasensis TaxID=66347 RepID=A0ABW9T7D8_9BACL|nr:efflux RND transporter periplasmic adaptor subunit [Paenibacillus campinasensis]MUG68164.1 efflux RND transporter periplasmic adaptor subunit [Paenibacillus campinasensis]
MKKVIKWLVIVSVLAVAGYWIYGQMKPGEPEVFMMEEPQVISFPVTEETVVSTVQVKGASEYGHETMVYAPFEGTVEAWNVTNGQQVKKGDVMFKLDQKPIRQQLQQKEAERKKRKLEQEKREMEQELKEFTLNQELDNAPMGATEAERLKMLADQESARLSGELDSVNELIEEQTITDLNDRLKKSTYTSPTAGIFLFGNSEQQPQSLTANQYIGKIVDLNSLQFVAYAGENEVFSIKPGMEVEVKHSSLKDIRLKGEVKEVAKFAETISQEKQTSQAPQFKVIISLPENDRLIGGLTLTGDIVTERKEKAVVVPKLAVLTEGETTYVMVDKGDGHIERQDIQTGMQTLDKIEVLSGLQPGDTVVLQ